MAKRKKVKIIEEKTPIFELLSGSFFVYFLGLSISLIFYVIISSIIPTTETIRIFVFSLGFFVSIFITAYTLIGKKEIKKEIILEE